MLSVIILVTNPLALLFFFDRCDSCIQNNREHCYHWPVGDEDSVRHFQQELALRLAEYEQHCGRQLLDVVRESQIIYNPTEVNRFGRCQ